MEALLEQKPVIRNE